MKKTRLISLLALLLACATLFGACAKRPAAFEEPEVAATEEPTAEPEETSTPTPSPSPTAEPTATPEPTPAPVYKNPLTGKDCDKDLSGSRPVAVMVENNRIIGGPVIGMYGINDADILYEMEVEKITRTMAVYSDISLAGQICPVRSARTYFVSIAMGYDAIYAHCGFSAEGNDWAGVMLDNNFTNDNIDVDEETGYRLEVYPHNGEHGLCTSGELLSKYISSNGVRTAHENAAFDYGMHFSETPSSANGQAANSVRIVFPEMKITSFTYNAEKGGYIGNNWDIEWIDCNNNEPGVFQNVIVLNAPTQIGVDAKWHSAITVTNYTGNGWYCNGGKYVPITWQRGDDHDCFHYFDEAGNELQLGVGRTYVGIMSSAYGGVSFG